MKIFVAGCGRSGTTLLQRLMTCFADTYVHESESPHQTLDCLDVPEANKVVKRTHRCWECLHDLPLDRIIIYSVRHPFDVLTSVHPQTVRQRLFHITPERWTNEYEALNRLREEQPSRKICYVKYENLVTSPDGVQQQIAEHCGLAIDHRFTEKLRLGSVRKWEHDPLRRWYISTLPRPVVKLARQFCNEFGYPFPYGLFVKRFWLLPLI